MGGRGTETGGGRANKGASTGGGSVHKWGCECCFHKNRGGGGWRRVQGWAGLADRKGSHMGEGMHGHRGGGCKGRGHQEMSCAQMGGCEMEEGDAIER